MKHVILAVFLGCISSAAMAELCTLSREQVSGDNKFCFYQCLRGDEVLTVRALAQCPLIKEFQTSRPVVSLPISEIARRSEPAAEAQRSR